MEERSRLGELRVRFSNWRHERRRPGRYCRNCGSRTISGNYLDYHVAEFEELCRVSWCTTCGWALYGDGHEERPRYKVPPKDATALVVSAGVCLAFLLIASVLGLLGVPNGDPKLTFAAAGLFLGLLGLFFGFIGLTRR